MQVYMLVLVYGGMFVKAVNIMIMSPGVIIWGTWYQYSGLRFVFMSMGTHWRHLCSMGHPGALAVMA